MGFDINNNVKSNGISETEFREAMLKAKVKEENVSSLWNRFNTNGDEQLDQDEQVGFFAWFKSLAGDDDEVSRKEAKKNDGNLSYKQLKRAQQGVQNLVQGNGKQAVTTDGNATYKVGNATYTYEEGHVKTKKDGDTTTTYTYGQNGKVKTKLLNDSKGSIETTFDNTGKNKLREVETNSDNTNIITRTYVNGQEVKSVTKDTSVSGRTLTKTKTPQGETIETVTGSEADKETKTEQFDSQGYRTKTTETKTGQEIVIDYKAKSRTTKDTKNNITIVETFDDFNEQSGEIGKISKKVITDNNKKLETTTEGERTTYRSLEQGGQTVIVEKGKAKIGNTELQATPDGTHVLSHRKFTGKGMETLEQAIIRLGFQKGTPEYEAIVKANKDIKPGEDIKIPTELATKKAFNAQNAKVDAKTEEAAYKKFKHNQWVKSNEQNVASRGKSAMEKWNSSGKPKLRETFASKNLGVYCTEKQASDKSQQHYIYNSNTNGLVTIESYLGLPKGVKVLRITADGQAKLSNDTLIKINRQSKTYDNNTSVSGYNNAFTKNVKDEVAQTGVKKTIYQKGQADTSYTRNSGNQVIEKKSDATSAEHTAQETAADKKKVEDKAKIFQDRPASIIPDDTKLKEALQDLTTAQSIIKRGEKLYNIATGTSYLKEALYDPTTKKFYDLQKLKANPNNPSAAVVKTSMPIEVYRAAQ